MLDFQEIKARVPIEQVLQLLGITPNRMAPNYADHAPYARALTNVVSWSLPRKSLFYCFSGCGGGDQLKLVSKMRNCDVKAAAQWIAEQTNTAPSRGGTPPPEQKRGLYPGHLP